MTEDLFIFPIVMVDGENEERKEQEKDRFGDIPGAEAPTVEYDIVYGEAEYPYYDFVGCEDRWLPTQRSLQRAMKKKFDACIVRFESIGQFLVPWTRAKFKEEISKFAKLREAIETVEEEESDDDKNITFNITGKEFIKILNLDNEKEGK